MSVIAIFQQQSGIDPPSGKLRMDSKPELLTLGIVSAEKARQPAGYSTVGKLISLFAVAKYLYDGENRHDEQEEVCSRDPEGIQGWVAINECKRTQEQNPEHNSRNRLSVLPESAREYIL